jgi:hypothetical protein
MPAPLHDVEFVLQEAPLDARTTHLAERFALSVDGRVQVVLLVSVYRHLRDQRYLDDAEWLVAEVERGARPSREFASAEPRTATGNFLYLAMWLYALSHLGKIKPEYQTRRLARAISSAFVIRGRGVIWKMKEDLSGPYPVAGYGALDSFNGYIAYRVLDDNALASEINEMRDLIERDYEQLQIDQIWASA